MSENNEFELLRDRKNKAGEGWSYAIHRMDLLIISISGAGVYVCLNTMQYIVLHCLPNSIYIKAAGILFVIAIILNFISQMTGKAANKHDMLMYDWKLDARDLTPEKQAEKIKEHDTKAEYYSIWTRRLNRICLTLMLLGLVVIMLYFCINF